MPVQTWTLICREFGGACSANVNPYSAHICHHLPRDFVISCHVQYILLSFNRFFSDCFPSFRPEFKFLYKRLGNKSLCSQFTKAGVWKVLMLNVYRLQPQDFNKDPTAD